MSTRPLSPQEQARVEWGLRPHYGGHTIGLWAVGLYLLIIGVFHGTLLFSYFMIRHEAPNWPPDGFAIPQLDGVLITSLILTATIVPAWLAVRSIRQGFATRAFLLMALMIAGGIVFLVFQAFDYGRLGLRPIDTVYPALVTALAGFHAVILVSTILITIVVMVRTWLGHFSAGRYLGVHIVLIIWSYVVLSWFATAGTIYLTPYLT